MSIIYIHLVRKNSPRNVPGYSLISYNGFELIFIKYGSLGLGSVTTTLAHLLARQHFARNPTAARAADYYNSHPAAAAPTATTTLFFAIIINISKQIASIRAHRARHRRLVRTRHISHYRVILSRQQSCYLRRKFVFFHRMYIVILLR